MIYVYHTNRISAFIPDITIISLVVAFKSAQDVFKNLSITILRYNTPGLSDIRYRPEQSTRGQPVGPCRTYAAAVSCPVTESATGSAVTYRGHATITSPEWGHGGQEHVLTTPYGNYNIVAMIYYSMYVFFLCDRW